MIKPNRVSKKRYVKWEQQREKHSRTRTKKTNVQKQITIYQKSEISKTKTNMQRQIIVKQVPNKKG